MADTIRETLQGTFVIGGRGYERIVDASKRRGTYRLAIDHKHGATNVINLDTNDNELKFYSAGRTAPFARIELSDNATRKLRKEIEDEFDVE